MAEAMPNPETGAGTNSEACDPPTAGSARAARFAHALLFTGHMIDRPGRVRPRFPAWAEPRVREAIRAAIEQIAWARSGSTLGLAGAASGGDLLFHEVCEELGIATRVLLALPEERFLAESVAPAGQGWVDRFHALLVRRGPDNVRVMGEDSGVSERSVWERANIWMIDQVIAAAAEQALLALWDGSVGDGPGGTEHFIEVARDQGLCVLEPIAMNALLEL